MNLFITVQAVMKLLIIAAGFSFCSILLASNVGFLKYAVITDFTEADIKQLQKEYLFTLNSKKPGEVHEWSNKETGNGGEIMVVKRYKQQGNNCKRLKFNTHSSQQSTVSYFNFCLFSSDWKLVN